METLADNGNGNYHYIDCIDEAERVLGEKLTANLVPLANDVKLQVEFNPAQVKGYRLIGYENRAMADEDFTDDTKDAGEVGPGHQFTVAYEIALADSAQDVRTIDLKYGADDSSVTNEAENLAQNQTSSEWLTCSMRYKLADSDEISEQSFVVDESDWTARPSADWQFAAAVIEAGMVLRDSDYSNGATLDDALDLLDIHERDASRAEFAKLIDRVAA